MVYAAAYNDKGKLLGDGSGFIAEENGKQWLYTNAHVISGAKKIEFRDSFKKLITGFSTFQCYSKKDGGGRYTAASTDSSGRRRNITKIFGADGVRMQLKQKRKFAFELPSSAPTVSVNTEVITLGDNRGKKQMDVLPGKVTAVHGTVYITNCKSEPGSSGGVLLLKEGFIPVGLNSWGFPLSAIPLDGIWNQKKLETFAGASELAGVTWITMKPSKFLAGRKKAGELRKAVQVMTLVYILVPDESGFTYKADEQFAGGLTTAQAIELLGNDPIFSPIERMQRKLNGRGRGKIGVNKMELVGLFAKALQESRRNYASRIALIDKEIAPYYQIDLQINGALRVGEWCHKGLGTAEKWFVKKKSVGGSLPVGKWYGKYSFDELIWED